MPIPETFEPNLCNIRMKFQIANIKVINSMGIAHIAIQIYGHNFKLPIYICDLGDLKCIFGMDA